MRVAIILSLFLLTVLGCFAQSNIIFSKAQHDFGFIAPSTTSYEQDFLFRNTQNSSASVSSVISSSKYLDAIHTRSSIDPGEYGFVKIKLRTDSLQGLFNEFVEVEIVSQEGVYTERIYVRADVNTRGNTLPARSFTDSEIALTVEVSPDDVADMEGFLGDDKLARAETEITYLRRQMKLQSELLFRFNEDLKAKQVSEQQNLEQLAILEKGIKENNTDEAILSQIDLLSERLLAIQKSDQALRNEFSSQEEEYLQLKNAADSARNYAEQLSHDLSERFKAEAAAIERANELESKLASRQLAEQKQRARIDSLQRVIRSNGNQDEAQMNELATLRNELAGREREQALQKNQASRQKLRLEQLQQEQQKLRSRGDSLAAYATEQGEVNMSLQSRLSGTEQRIKDYEIAIDSLQMKAKTALEVSKEADTLRGLLVELEKQDVELENQITSQQKEIELLEQEKLKTSRSLQAMESATSRQLEEAHKLMHRINGLSTREGEARLEAMNLKKDLAQARNREAEVEKESIALKASLQKHEASIEEMELTLNNKMNQVNALKQEQGDLNEQLSNSVNELSKVRDENDSLSVALNTRESNLKALNDEIANLEGSLKLAKESEARSAERTEKLTSDLASVRLSNEMTFDEMRQELVSISQDRDQYREDLYSCKKEVDNIQKALAKAKQQEAAALAFAHELQSTGKKQEEIVYRVHILSSKQRIKSNQLFENVNDLMEYQEAERFQYAGGSFSNLAQAQLYQKELERMGFGMAKVIAFRNTQQISLEEALETALK